MTPTVIFSEESVDTLIRDGRKLFRAHSAEVEPMPDLPYEPVEGAYRELSRKGYTRVYTARSLGDLIGYAVFVIAPHQNHGGMRYATQYLLYVVPAHRPELGKKFIRWCEMSLKDLGVGAIEHRVSNRRDFGPVLERMGYICTEKVYCKIV